MTKPNTITSAPPDSYPPIGSIWKWNDESDRGCKVLCTYSLPHGHYIVHENTLYGQSIDLCITPLKLWIKAIKGQYPYQSKLVPA